MLEFDEKSLSLSPEEMINNTRENGRNLNHYQDIFEQNKLPRLTLSAGATVLEIGTGLGNAIPGILALTENKGKVVSIDINGTTLEVAKSRLKDFYSQTNHPSLITEVGMSQPKDSIDVSLFIESLPSTLQSDITLIQADISYRFQLPSATFDYAISVWVFYQILDKLRALKNVLQSLKPSGKFYAVSTGSVAFTREQLSEETIAWLRERVWNTRASRFSWLTGTRELVYWANTRGIIVKVISLADAIKLFFPKITVQTGMTIVGRPEGSFVIEIPSDSIELVNIEFDLAEGSFVSTRSSSVIPIYHTPELF